MKKLLIFAVVFAVALSLGITADWAYAGQGNRGNGFPEGDHYNLNLIAKKSNTLEPGYFDCPCDADYKWDYYKDGLGTCTEALIGTDACEKCDPTDPCDGETAPWGECTVRVASTQNVVFVPRDNDVDGGGVQDMDITIRIKSGSDRPGKGKKIKVEYPVLTVTDWCTEHFPDFGETEGDLAELQLPENAGGYAVYARVTGKPPVVDPAWKFLVPGWELVQDEYGNDLYYAGTIGGADGCTDANGISLDRIDTNKHGRGKGVKKATDLTCLFQFTGDVCYVNDLCYYCDEFLDPPCDEGPFPGNDAGFVCCKYHCLDAEEEPCDCGEVGCECIEDSCEVCANFECKDPTWICEGDPLVVCAWKCVGEGFLQVDPLCRNYEDPTWVFNIADFVNVLWKSEGHGAYVIQVRFYPL